MKRRELKKDEGHGDNHGSDASMDGALALNLNAASVPEGKTRLLFLVADRKNMETAEAYLNSRNFQLHFTADLVAAMKTMSTFKPHLVLLSGNLKLPQMAVIHKLFTEKFDSPCIMFMEANDPEAFAQLTDERQQIAFGPPISGPSIEKKVQDILERLRGKGPSAIHQGGKQDKTSHLRNAMKDAVEAVCPPASQTVPKLVPSQPVGAKPKVTFAVIETSRCRGTICGITMSGQADPKVLKAILEKIQRKMETFGEPMTQSSPVLDFPADHGVNELTQEGAEFWFQTTHENEVYTFAYFPLAALPQVQQAQDGYLSVNLADFLPKAEVLSFDLFLYLPKNDKFIHYLKKDSSLAPPAKEKLHQHGIQNLFIKDCDRENYMVFCIRNALKPGSKPK